MSNTNNSNEDISIENNNGNNGNNEENKENSEEKLNPESDISIKDKTAKEIAEFAEISDLSKLTEEEKKDLSKLEEELDSELESLEDEKEEITGEKKSSTEKEMIGSDEEVNENVPQQEPEFKPEIDAELEARIQAELERKKKKSKKKIMDKDAFKEYLSSRRNKIVYHALWHLVFNVEDHEASKMALYESLKEVTSKNPVEPIEEHKFYFGLGFILRLKFYEQNVIQFKDGKLKIAVNVDNLKEILKEIGEPISDRPIITKEEEKNMIADFLNDDFLDI